MSFLPRKAETAKSLTGRLQKSPSLYTALYGSFEDVTKRNL